MSSAFMASSPTAKLFRHSKLFSLPPTLSAANIDQPVFNGVVRSSKHATLPYPIRQTISTPHKSRMRGEWGLKRPLPVKRTTKTHSANLSVIEWDTREKVTDFQSGNQYAYSLRKFEEMGIAFTRQLSSAGLVGTRFMSAFDSAHDNTYTGLSTEEVTELATQNGRSLHFQDLLSKAKSPEYSVFGLSSAVVSSQFRFRADELASSLVSHSKDASHSLTQLKTRWKFNGPWLGIMSEGDFRIYADKVKNKSAHFQSFLKEFVIEKLHIELARQGREKAREALVAATNNPESVDSLPPITADIPSVPEIRTLLDNQSDTPLREEYDKIMKELVSEHAGNASHSSLSQLIRLFLDLPPVEWETQYTQVRDSQFPLSTHPSVGMSYLQSNSRVVNHPLAGPQSTRMSVLSRILSSSVAANRSELGVAGFVVPVEKHFACYTIGGQAIRSNYGAQSSSSADIDDGASSNLSMLAGGETTDSITGAPTHESASPIATNVPYGSNSAPVSISVDMVHRQMDKHRVDGGPKVWTTPEDALVDSFGKIHIGVRPSPEAAWRNQNNEFDQIGASIHTQLSARMHVISDSNGYLGGDKRFRPNGGFKRDGQWSSSRSETRSKLQARWRSQTPQDRQPAPPTQFHPRTGPRVDDRPAPISNGPV